MSPSFSFLLPFIAAWNGISFSKFMSALLAMSPPKAIPLLGAGGLQRSLEAVQALLSSGQSTGVSNTVLARRTKPSRMRAAAVKSNSIPARPNSALSIASCFLP